jgi:hypothetical protein
VVEDGVEALLELAKLLPNVVLCGFCGFVAQRTSLEPAVATRAATA